jgi:L,D-transpeptidase ErfK/SrfK
MKNIIQLLFVLSFISSAAAECFPLQSTTNVVGQIKFAKIAKGDNFTKLAQKYDVGYDQLQQANPRLDSENPLVNAAIVIPSQYIIPKVNREGIVINLAQMRLFYFPKDKQEVCTYPVGIGKQNWQTPEGKLFIAEKIKNPVWIVPDAIMKYRAENGDPVSKIMQSGPDNPLGYYAMRLSYPTYLIHGTNEPDSIGRRSSAGCIHLFGDDIKALFDMTPLHTSVQIINFPYLLASQDGITYFAAYNPLIEMQQQFAKDPSLQDIILLSAINAEFPNGDFDPKYKAQLEKLIAAPTGLTVELSHDSLFAE